MVIILFYIIFIYIEIKMDKIKEYENRIENLEKLNINLNDEFKKMELKFKDMKMKN